MQKLIDGIALKRRMSTGCVIQRCTQAVHVGTEVDLIRCSDLFRRDVLRGTADESGPRQFIGSSTIAGALGSYAKVCQLGKSILADEDVVRLSV